MSQYIIRLDDACPQMNKKNWARVEQILDKYNVKPIVGVIPQNEDSDFQWEEDPYFWNKVKLWQDKRWEICLHGLHHNLHYHEPTRGYYQLSHGVKTEFAGLSFSEQRKMIEEGLSIFEKHNIKTRGFFAPAHTYDFNTVSAIKESASIEYISDGYALCPYKKDGVTFIPSICDGPFKMPLGLYTFVLHPSMMSERSFLRLERFLNNNNENIVSVDEVIDRVQMKQGITGKSLEVGIYIARAIRKRIKK